MLIDQPYLLSQVIMRAANYYPNYQALLIEKRFVTYAQLYRDVCRFSEILKQNGFHSRARVALLSGNTYLTVVSYWAVLMLGGTVSIIPSDTLPMQLMLIIKNFDPAVIIRSTINDEQRLVLKEINPNWLEIIFDNENSFYDALSVAAQPKEVFLSESLVSSDLAMIVYTSGSTGSPKGVMLTHTNMLSAMRSINAYLKIARSDRIYSVLPLHFDYGLYQMLLAFSVGALLVLENSMPVPTVFFNNIKNHQCTILPLLPGIASLLSISLSPQSPELSSVRKITNTGERLSSSQIAYLKTIFVSADIYLMYGLTECKRCTYLPPDQLPYKNKSIGKTMMNLSMWVEGENGKVLSPFEIGEFVVSGPSVMQGYWRNESATQLKCRYDLFGRQCLYTGDRGYVDAEGYFYLLGRNDAIQKINGEKCDLQYYTEKLESIETINRVYLFIHSIDDMKSFLILCIESRYSGNHNKIDRQQCRSFFSSNHQPAYMYITDQFPSLKNGKLDFQCLKKLSLLSWQENNVYPLH